MSLLQERYRLERVLGQGTSGVAYLATDVRSGAAVVVKRFHAGAGDGWQREARALQALDHPAIPPFLDAFEAEVALVRHPHLVQGFVEGAPVGEWARARARSRAEVLELLAQVLEVLGYLQSLAPPVLHRDVKPGNVLVRPDGRIALVDFGSAVPDLARTFGRTLAAGTLGYQAPEQVQGSPVPASDVYSAAAMTLELLTGVPLPEMLGNDATLRWQKHAGRLGELEGWFRRALAPVEQRFPTAREALAALAPALPPGRVRGEISSGGALAAARPARSDARAEAERRTLDKVEEGLGALADAEARARGWLDVALRAQALGDDARLERALAGVRAAAGDGAAWRWLGEASAGLGPVAEVRAWREALADALAEEDSERVDDALEALSEHPEEARDLLLAVGQRLGVRAHPSLPLAALRAQLEPALEARAQRRHAHAEAAALGVSLPPQDGTADGPARQRAALAAYAADRALFAARNAAWGREVGTPPVFGDPERAAWARAVGEDLARAAAWRAAVGAARVPWPLGDVQLAEARAADPEARRRAREAREAAPYVAQARQLAAAWTAAIAAAQAAAEEELQARDALQAAEARASGLVTRWFGDTTATLQAAREAHAAAQRRAEAERHTVVDRSVAFFDLYRACDSKVRPDIARALPTPSRIGEEQHALGAVRFTMARVSPGWFRMGSPDEEAGRSPDETLHEVLLTRAFAIATTPVTQALWSAVMGYNRSVFNDGPEAPLRAVEKVSWYDAVRLCNALSARLGMTPAYRIGRGEEPTVERCEDADGFRLPTEAEWECAARAGTAQVYAGGDELDAVGWYAGNSGRTTHPVGGKRANAWGLHDMSGNVWEWCGDVYGGYATEGAVDPSGDVSGPLRVRRGGSWSSSAVNARAAYRCGDNPGFRVGILGFRLSRTIP